VGQNVGKVVPLARDARGGGRGDEGKGKRIFHKKKVMQRSNRKKKGKAYQVGLFKKRQRTGKERGSGNAMCESEFPTRKREAPTNPKEGKQTRIICGTGKKRGSRKGGGVGENDVSLH